MAIDIRHILPYVPYDVKYQHWISEKDNTARIMTVSDVSAVANYDSHKLVLRPISDLKSDEFVMENWRKSTIIFLCETANLPYNSRFEHVGGIMYSDFLKLMEWHFDIFGLIPKGLAIDINTLKNNNG